MKIMRIQQDALPAVLGLLLPVLVILPILLLTGCQATQTSPNCPPPAPRLGWLPAEDGGVCVTPESTAQLLDYIDALERCAIR